MKLQNKYEWRIENGTIYTKYKIKLKMNSVGYMFGDKKSGLLWNH